MICHGSNFACHCFAVFGMQCDFSGFQPLIVAWHQRRRHCFSEDSKAVALTMIRCFANEFRYFRFLQSTPAISDKASINA